MHISSHVFWNPRTTSSENPDPRHPKAATAARTCCSSSLPSPRSPAKSWHPLQLDKMWRTKSQRMSVSTVETWIAKTHWNSLLSYGVLWLCRTRLDGIVVLQTTQPWHLDRSQRHPTESRTKPFSAAWIQTSSTKCRKWPYTCHRESPFGLIWKRGITVLISYYIYYWLYT